MSDAPQFSMQRITRCCLLINISLPNGVDCSIVELVTAAGDGKPIGLAGFGGVLFRHKEIYREVGVCGINRLEYHCFPPCRKLPCGNWKKAGFQHPKLANGTSKIEIVTNTISLSDTTYSVNTRGFNVQPFLNESGHIMSRLPKDDWSFWVVGWYSSHRNRQ